MPNEVDLVDGVELVVELEVDMPDLVEEQILLLVDLELASGL